nr:unnamed protein product [Digitaria exilis]
MAEDGAPDPEQLLRQVEDRLRDVGQRLLAPPDEAEDLLKLLKEVEQCLLKVDQSPPESTSNAIRPATEALVKKELMGHPDPDVRLGVASCISEITRITAPDAPYDDDAMRDVFSLIVSSFQHLDNIKDPFFGRRVSILDTVAKVRSCVVMLDLECDDLINDMFHHFLRTVSSGHSDAVISCMETIMRLVIEESEDVQPQIASCLLQNVRKEEKESSSPSFELAEKVIDSCREKLKPVFLQSLKGTSLSEYSQIVASVCEEDSDDKEDNVVDPSGKDTEDNIVDPSGKDMVDDGKLSERTISEELPQETSKAEQDVSRPEQDGSSMNGNTGAAISSDATPADNGAESIAAEPKKKALAADKSTKLNPSDKSEEIAHSGADTKKDLVASGEEGSNGAADDTSKPVDATPVKPRRGRPPGPKSSEKKTAGKKSLDLKKTEEASDSARKLKKTGEGESSKKLQTSSLKQQKDGNISEEKLQKSSLKQQKDRNISEEDPAKDLSLKLPRSRKSKGLDGSLVGARIKVWWPDDKKFYKGVVESFDSGSKKHKVAYDDGDVEVLLLRDEKWEFISEEKGASVVSETPRGRKRKGDAVKEEKTETPKSSDAVDPPKKRGRPKGWRPNNGTPSNNSSASPSTKGKSVSKDLKETPKTDSNLSNEGEKASKDKASGSTEKTKDELPKDGDDKSASKSKEASNKTKDSKDEGKSTEGKGRPGRKQKNPSSAVIDADKEKQKEKEGKTAEIEQEASANASAGKKRRRKA